MNSSFLRRLFTVRGSSTGPVGSSAVDTLKVTIVAIGAAGRWGISAIRQGPSSLLPNVDTGPGVQAFGVFAP